MSTATTEAQTIVELRVDHLHESPFNQRKVFGEQGLDELAADIVSVGRVLQPLLVRPRVPPLFSDVPGAEAGYEIVFGHRRFRAATMAGLTTVPCMVRSMDDQEVKRAQISENLQRENVHPIEEAEGFQALMRDHQQTADDIAEQTGKSRSYVYGRLKLLQACPEVRDACLHGKIGSEVALLIARVGSFKLQAKALGYINGKYLKLEDGGQESYRRVRDLLNERFTLAIKEAIFDPEEATLTPAGRCSSCPKRSANAPEFVDVAEGAKIPSYRSGNNGPNVCTDPECFASKKTAHLARQAAALEAKGKVVIGGNRARALVDAHGNLKGGYMLASAVPAELKGMAAGAMGVNLQRVVIQNPRNGKTLEVVKRAEAKAGAAKLRVHLPDPEVEANASRHANSAQEEAQRKRNEAKLQAENGRRRDLLDQARAAVRAAPRSAWDMRLIARELLEHVGYGGADELIRELYAVDDRDAIADRIDSMSADDLALLALDCLLVSEVRVQGVYWLDRKPEALLAAAKHYGVATSTPAPAGASGKTAKAGAGGVKSKGKPAAVAQGQLDAFAEPAAAGEEQSDDAGVAGEETPAEAHA